MKRTLATTLAVAILALPLAANASLTQLTNLYVFGDSLSDGGNSGLLSQAATSGAFTYAPPPYAAGRASNGQVAVEYLWQLFNPGGTNLMPSLAGGTNYAILGATTGSENYNSINPNVPGFLRPAYDQKATAWQLSTFAGQRPSFDPASSLFVVWLFGNDVYYFVDSGGALPGTVPGSPGGSNLVENGIANIMTTVQTLAMSGARHLLVPNLPDMGSAPEVLGTPQAAALSALTLIFNQNLAIQLDGLQAAVPALDIIQFDTAGTFAELLANPNAAGFDVADKACLAGLTVKPACDPETWVFWDGVHPTTATHEYLAQRMYAAVVPEPQTYALMGLGLAVIGWASRRRSR